jgi:response regulator RpfG family c-di-GMP phosphodiesterase
MDSQHRIIEANNGEEALAILENKETIPDIILFWLNTEINGIEFFRHIKKADNLKYIPTIILTTSNNRKDVLGVIE